MLKRTLSNQITNSLIDEVYETGMKAGALGGKLLGAGGGGFVLFFAEPDRHLKIKAALNKFLHVPIRFDEGGSQVIYSSPEITTLS
jgi:D-glycero-alpha-D-manno-heptose-7-phosphate kinase